MPAPREEQAAAVALGLQVAVAATLCLFLTEAFHLQMSALSVYSVHMIMSQFTFSAYQKGVERFGGRVLGVLYGLLLIVFFQGTPILYLVLAALGLLGFFYVYASNHLAYAMLNGGLFVAYMAIIGISAPETAPTVTLNIVQQLALGMGVAFLVEWVTGSERTLAIHAEGNPLWPVRLDWLNKSAMITTSQLGAGFVAVYFNLPAIPTTISAAMVAVMPDWQSMHKKGIQRAEGALLGGAYAFVCLILLKVMPHFFLMLALVFCGMFLASYYTKASQTHSYVALQMGLVMPLVLIGDTNELGSLRTAVQRLIGVGAGLFIAEAVFLLWPIRPSTALVPAQTPVSAGS